MLGMGNRVAMHNRSERVGTVEGNRRNRSRIAGYLGKVKHWTRQYGKSECAKLKSQGMREHTCLILALSEGP
jgi:hypothetical protein